MRSPRRVAGEVAALARTTRAARVAYAAPVLATVVRARRARARQGFEYEEALEHGLLDPAMPQAERAGFVGRHPHLQALERLNGDDRAPVVGEKAVFSLHCSALGLPVPRLLGILDRRGGGQSRSGRPLRELADWRAFLAEDVPEEIAIKPCTGYSGRAVRVLSRRAGLWEEPSGGGVDEAVLWRELRGEPDFPAFLVEERLHNHPDIERLGRGGTLNTVRIVTLVERSGEVSVLWAALKLGLHGGAADNFVLGRSGNALVEVDELGRLGAALLAAPSGYGVRRVPASSLGAREGEALPHWEAARALARRAALRFLPLRSLGWDIGLTPEGPVIVESNTRWGPLPGPGMAAMLQRVRAAA